MRLPSCGYLTITYVSDLNLFLKKNVLRLHNTLFWDTWRSLISVFYLRVEEMEEMIQHMYTQRETSQSAVQMMYYKFNADKE